MEKLKQEKQLFYGFIFLPTFRVILHCFMYGKLTEFDISQSFDPEDLFHRFSSNNKKSP